MEPIWLWTEYGEARYRDRMLRIEVNENGLEVPYFDGRPSALVRPGVISTIGTMGKGGGPSPERRYMDTMPYGGADPQERVALLDREHIERAVLYPTIGLFWPAEVTDPELAYAYARAYNRWIADYCRDSGGRLVPVAYLPMFDPEESVKELRRAVRDGCRGAFLTMFSHTRKPFGHPDNDPVWAAAQDLAAPIALHPANEPRWADPATARYDNFTSYWFTNVTIRDRMTMAFLTFFAYGTMERFPGLRLGILESGGGWIGSLLERMDVVYEHSTGAVEGTLALPLSEPPSSYFRRQCFISCDPDERSAARIIEDVGVHSFIWASDYPHGDHPSTYAIDVSGLVAHLDPAGKAAVLGQNVVDIYDLGPLAAS
jgi:predicted TIM-barrel fold metal-dependent hydrolase